MSRDSKRKLAIVAGISECLVYAEAKYCAFEIHGEPKYYVCPRTEYCCNFGCCVSPGFQIYHLWYYWLLVIIMFLVCSGGGWWYRYWLQGRYRAAASAIPSRGAVNSRGQNALRGPICPAQQASITYNTARNTVLLHRMWKGAGHHRGPGSSPAYSGPPVGSAAAAAAAAAASSTHFQNTSVVLNDVNCPYYQLYGPPPSYETVIAQTRGKLSSPMSPERRGVDMAMMGSATGSASISANEDTPRCYNHSPYNNPSESVGGVCQSPSVVDATLRRIDEPTVEQAASAFTRYDQSYLNNAEEETNTPVHVAGRQETSLPIRFNGRSLDYHHVDEVSPAVGVLPETFRIYRASVNLERLPSYREERAGFADPKANRRGMMMRHQVARSPENFGVPGDPHSSVPDLNIDEPEEIIYHRGALGSVRSKTPQQEHHRFDEARYSSATHGGSLKFSRRRDDTSSRINRRGTLDVSEVGTSSVLPSWREREANRIDRSSLGRSTKTGSGAHGVAFGDAETPGENAEFEDTGAFSRSTRNGLLGCDASSPRFNKSANRRCADADQRTNPSDNVILDEPLTSVNIIATPDGDVAPSIGAEEIASSRWSATATTTVTSSSSTRRPAAVHDRREDRDDDHEGRPDPRPSTAASSSLSNARTANNDHHHQTLRDFQNHESKHSKLDRSRSLD